MGRRLAAGLFVAHGVAHLVGFSGAWRLGEFEDAPYTTLILNGAIDVGDVGARMVGLVWLLAAALFVVAAVATWRRGLEARAFVASVAILSLGVCVVGLPASWAGVVIDIVVLGGLAALNPAAHRSLQAMTR